MRVPRGASVRTSSTLGRYSSAIRAACANERSCGSARGAISNGRPYRDRNIKGAHLTVGCDCWDHRLPKRSAVMNQEKYIGMDVHQATISVPVMDRSGKLIMECILETKAATILEFIDGLRETLSVTFEEGNSAAWLHDLLHSRARRFSGDVCRRDRWSALRRRGSALRRNSSRRRGSSSAHAHRLPCGSRLSPGCLCFWARVRRQTDGSYPSAVVFRRSAQSPCSRKPRKTAP